MSGQSAITVEVIYPLPDEQRLIKLELPAGTTVREAVEQSGLLQKHPELLDEADPWTGRVGIFGRVVRPDRQLADGDRVEVYRPLVMDPKEARRRRAGLGGQDKP